MQQPSSGLIDFGIPEEVAHDIHNEEDLVCIINSINATAAEDNASNLPTHISTDSQSELPFRYHHEPPVYSSPVSSPIFSPSPNPYIEDSRIILKFVYFLLVNNNKYLSHVVHINNIKFTYDKLKSVIFGFSIFDNL